MNCVRTLLSSLWLSVFLVGCGAGDVPKSAKPLIGVSLLTLENPFFRVIGDTIRTEATGHGFETVVVSADKDPAKQSNQMQDFIVRKVRAIVISPCESKAMVPEIGRAHV